MKKIRSLLLVATLAFVGCKKTELRNISTALVQNASPVSDAAPLCGSIKGTMLSGKTYTINCNGDVAINKGDTLVIQPGVRINVASNSAIVVRGVLLSLGTPDKPNWITVDGITKQDAPGQNPATDPAYSGKWKGILADTTSPLMVIKWTHIEYAGATLGPVANLLGLAATDPSYALFFQNMNGSFVFEDSWLYGTADDAIRVSGGKFALLRNTFEKCGSTGGDVLNIKSGSTGDMAYNMFIGNATNSLKASNKGGAAVQTNVRIYNNTIVNGGYRQVKTGRGGSINFEEGASGMAYNNLIVNCKFGLRVVKTPPADTTKLSYGYNYYYGDSASVVNEIYPTTYITKPQNSDYPAASSFLPANYSYGAVYDGTSLIGKNNPLFINYPLPAPSTYRLRDIATIGSYKFGLQSSSPAIGKGYTGFTPLALIAVDETYGVSSYDQPGVDIGCYQINGKGNKHF